LLQSIKQEAAVPAIRPRWSPQATSAPMHSPRRIHTPTLDHIHTPTLDHIHTPTYDRADGTPLAYGQLPRSLHAYASDPAKNCNLSYLRCVQRAHSVVVDSARANDTVRMAVSAANETQRVAVIAATATKAANKALQAAEKSAAAAVAVEVNAMEAAQSAAAAVSAAMAHAASAASAANAAVSDVRDIESKKRKHAADAAHEQKRPKVADA
jgi:hypothetical protein